MAEAKPPTNAAGQTPAPQDPLAGLLNANSGAPPLFPRTPKTTSLLPNVTNARLYTCSRYPPAPQQEMRAIDPRDEERRRRQANNLGIMFLGPVFGAPAALGRLAGAPENVVENLGQLGLDAASVVGVPGARGARRVIEPVPVKPVPTRVVRVTPVETGVFILRRSIKFSVKQLDKKFKHSKDFGVETTKKNPDTLNSYKYALENHMNDPATIEKGTYIHSPDSKVFYNPNTNNVVIVNSSGEFLSGWRLTPGTQQYVDYTYSGKLF